MLQAFEVTVMPLLPRQPEKGELGGSVGIYGQQRCGGHDNNYERESEKAVHVYRQVAIDGAG